MSIDFNRLTNLCSEISALENKVADIVKAELTDAVTELVSILNDNTPSVEIISWYQDKDSVISNVLFFPRNGLSTEGNMLLEQVSAMIRDMGGVFNLALGSEVGVSINLLTGKLKTSRGEQYV